MPKLVFLGTGSAVPSAEDIRNDCATWLSYGKNCNILVDCGEGTKYNLLRAKLSRLVHHIFLTHDHYDHLLGITGLLAMISLTIQDAPPITIYGPPSALERANILVDMVRSKAGQKLTMPVEYRSLAAGEIVDMKLAYVNAFATKHRELPSLGYVFLNKCSDLEYKVIFTGDTTFLPSFSGICHHASNLVVNANFADADIDSVVKKGHMTVYQAAEMAQKAQAKRLFLQHLSPRYARERESILMAARSIFPETYFAEDLQTLNW